MTKNPFYRYVLSLSLSTFLPLSNDFKILSFPFLIYPRWAHRGDDDICDRSLGDICSAREYNGECELLSSWDRRCQSPQGTDGTREKYPWYEYSQFPSVEQASTRYDRKWSFYNRKWFFNRVYWDDPYRPYYKVSRKIKWYLYSLYFQYIRESPFWYCTALSR